MKQGEFSFSASRSVLGLCGVAALLGGGAWVVGLFQAPERAWLNLLLVSYYLMSMGLAGIVFLALQYVSSAGWAVAIRRVPEAMSSILPVSALSLVLVLLARPSLYPWTGAAQEEATTPLRHVWFSYPFFLARALIYLSVWVLLGSSLVRISRRQDGDGALALTRKNVRLSAGFLVIFAFTFWLANHDWLMSLEPEWTSTIFAVYQFAGLFLGGLACLIVLAAWLRWLGPFRHVLTQEHAHDLGKLLFGFSTFWMYLWFCQYMLIWYVNNPEETVYFTRRLGAGWLPFLVLNIILNWAIPFLVLLPRATKRHVGVLALISLVILAGRWLDLYLVVVPSSSSLLSPFALWEVCLPVGALGLLALVFFIAFGRAPILPVGDPFLVESLPTASKSREHSAPVFSP